MSIFVLQGTTGDEIRVPCRAALDVVLRKNSMDVQMSPSDKQRVPVRDLKNLSWIQDHLDKKPAGNFGSFGQKPVGNLNFHVGPYQTNRPTARPIRTTTRRTTTIRRPMGGSGGFGFGIFKPGVDLSKQTTTKRAPQQGSLRCHGINNWAGPGLLWQVVYKSV